MYIFEFPELQDHECARTCEWPPEPRSCRYVFTIEWLDTMSSACYDCPLNITDCGRPECLPVNGIERAVVVINRQLPGPPIQVKTTCLRGNIKSCQNPLKLTKLP